MPVARSASPLKQELLMAYLDRPELIGALVLLASALFVSIRLVKPPYQAWVTRACIVSFVLALGVVLLWVVVWLAS
jgi:hypothetical protein